MEVKGEAVEIKEITTERSSFAGVGSGAPQSEFDAIEFYRNSSNEEEVDDVPESADKGQRTEGVTGRLKLLFRSDDSVEKDSMASDNWEKVNLWAKEHLWKMFTFGKTKSRKRKESTVAQRRLRKFKKLRKQQLTTIQDLERKYLQARNKRMGSSESRSVRKEESLFYRLRERAKRKLKGIENDTREIIAIPVTLLRLKDPGNDMASYQYWTNRVLRRYGRPFPPYDDWMWFRAQSRGAEKHDKDEKQEWETVLARSEGVRALLPSERKALADAAMHFYDPNENRRRILRKFHVERREYESQLRHKPSCVTPRFTTRMRRHMSSRIDSMDSMDKLPTYRVCCENPHDLLPENEKNQGPSTLGFEAKPLQTSATLLSCAYQMSHWWCPENVQDEVLPFTSSSSAGSYNDTERAHPHTISVVVKAEIHQSPRNRYAPSTQPTDTCCELTSSADDDGFSSADVNPQLEIRSSDPITPDRFIDEMNPEQKGRSPTTLSGKPTVAPSQSNRTNGPSGQESQHPKDLTSWCPRCTFVDPLQQWIQSCSTSTWSSSNHPEEKNADELETNSSTTPEDPYQKVFAGDDLALVRPYGDRKPVFVYQVDVVKLTEAEQREALRQHHARPPCICRPGFPKEGICREYASPLHKDTTWPLTGKFQKFLLLVLFLVKLAISWFIILLLLHLFLSANRYTNIDYFPEEIELQQVYNTYLDIDNTTKYYIFNNTLKHVNVTLAILIYGPLAWPVMNSSDEPHFCYLFVRVYYKNASYNRQNVELKEVLPGLLNLSEEVPNLIYFSQLYINTTECPEEKSLNITDYDLQDRTWHHNISSISYLFNVDWSFVVQRYTKDDQLESHTVTAVQHNNAYKFMGISQFALWYWNQSLGQYHFNSDIHTEITNDQEGHSYFLAKDHDRYLSPKYEILNTQCYYSYSTLNVTNVNVWGYVLLSWSNIPFAKFASRPAVWDYITFYSTEVMRSAEGNSRRNHSIFANETSDESEYTVTYAFKYTAAIFDDIIVADEFKRRSVGLAFKFIGCDDPTYTTTTRKPRDPKFPFKIDPEAASSYILYTILGLYVALFLQVSRALSVIITAVACVSITAFLNVKPTYDIIVKYFELNHMMRYVFIMLWNGRVADTGVYDVFAKYTAMNLFALPFVLPWVYFLTICATFLSDNVIAMLVLTPYVIRVFEALKQNPKPILTSMIVLTNVTAMYSEHSSIFNRLLVQRHVDYVQEIIIWKEFPFYLQNMVSGSICLGLAIGWFYILFAVCKPQKRKGIEVFELKHEAKLWAKVDDSRTLGSGQVDFMKRIYADERYYLIRELREGRPLRLWAKYQKIRDVKALMQLCFIMILFCTLLYIMKRVSWSRVQFDFDATGVLSLLMIPLLVFVNRDVPLRRFFSRIDMSTLAMMEAFFFIGNTLCLLRYPERIVKYIHGTYPNRDDWAGVVRACTMNMLWIATVASAVLGLGASLPLIETAKLISNDIKDYVGEEIGSNVYSKSLRPIVWSITLGANIGGCATLLGNMPALATSVNAGQQGYRIGALEYFVLCSFPVAVMILINYGYWAGLLYFTKED